MSDPVVIAVPPKGGSLSDVLGKLETIGWLRQDLVHEIRRLIKADKRRVKLEEGLMHLWATNGCEKALCMRAADQAGHDLDDVDRALRRMRQYTDVQGNTQIVFTPKSGVDAMLNAWRQEADALTREAAYTLHLELDLARHGKPNRIMFDQLEFSWGKHSAILVGTEHEVTPTYLRKHKRDISLTCYDAFHNTLLDALDTGNVRNWHELNEHLITANTDVRILGSLGLNDYLGHFILAPQSHCDELLSTPLGNRCWSAAGDAKMSLLQGKKVLIDAAYEAVYNQLLDPITNGIEFEASDGDIEEETIARSLPAVYIVRSGATIAATPGLCVVGEEIITSETIVAVNQERVDHNKSVGALVESLAPTREDNAQHWRGQLAGRLGPKLF